MQRLVTLALIVRPPRSREIGEREIYDSSNLPGPLVWVDAGVSRALLESAINAPKAFDAEQRWHWEKVARAMAAADPAGAAMKVRELVETGSDLEPRDRWRWQLDMARYLALTREEQMRESVDGWMPGKWADE